MRCSACSMTYNNEKPLSMIEATPDQWRRQCAIQDAHYLNECEATKPEPEDHGTPRLASGGVDYELLILEEQDERYDGA